MIKYVFCQINFSISQKYDNQVYRHKYVYKHSTLQESCIKYANQESYCKYLNAFIYIWLSAVPVCHIKYGTT